MTRVRDLLDLPEQVRKMDFTVALTEGVAHPQQTVETYVVTPRLADAFDQALGLIHAALRDGSSLGTYLHGSFGSGKSHFMAMLSLLLADEEVAWSRTEFHPLRAKYDWVGQKKILELHMHMLGKNSLEDAIYPAYLEHIARHHPDAPIPAIFADEALFTDAITLMDRMGEAAFVGAMNPPPVEDDGGWGDVAEDDRWTRERVLQAAKSTDREVRAKLLDALLKTHFPAYRSSARAYRELDEGLWVLSHHAKALGYDVVVLFLDELILRMSMGASRPQWLNDMVMSMVKLRESTHSNRAIPFVSFIARQRALQEMVGDQLAGPDAHRLEHALSLARGRFNEIELPNQELPAIVERRILRAKDTASKQAIDAAFEQLQKTATKSWATLTTGQYDAKDFRRLYPFSPSLVETLIALSTSLQRQRTSIKLLTEMLVEHIEDLQLGGLVGVGDLFDLLASGDESATGIIGARFKAAIDLYKHKLLPMIQRTHGTNTPARCQRERDDHQLRLGCANCGERACRNDNRVVKTLLVAALTPEAPALKDLTVSRLVELNHGHIRTPIPGQEKQAVAGKLRKWASELHQIQVGRQDDPSVAIELHGVDLKPILDQARSVDSPARRQAEIRRMLFDEMGVGQDVEFGVDQTIEWRGSRRLGHVRFGNVRTMTPQVLRCPDDHDWRLLVDFPFDEPGHGPTEDEGTLETFRHQHGGSWTLVWLPSFFSDAVNALLGELVVLNHILESASLPGYIKHLSPDQQTLAVNSMRSLQAQKRQQVLEAMRKAYGISSAGPDDEQLDPSRRMPKPLHTLQPGLDIRPGLAADLSQALQRYIPALLDERYPRHPRFPKIPRKKLVEDVLRVFDELVDREDHKVPLDKNALEDVRGFLGELGFVRVTENAALLRDDGTIQALEKKRMQKAIEHPTAGQIAAWFDEDGKLGLQPDAMAMVIRAYARATARTLVSGGEPYVFVAGKPVPAAVVLEKPDLPSPSAWADGLAMAGHLGITLPSKALHGDNLKRLQKSLNDRLAEVAKDVLRLPGELRAWHEVLGLPMDTPRLTTADSADDLVRRLQGKPAVEQIRTLAAFEPRTSASALASSLGAASKTVTVLGNKLTLGVFQQLQAKATAEARDILEKAAKALRQDELQITLADSLRQLAERGQELLVSAAPSYGASHGAPAGPGAATGTGAPGGYGAMTGTGAATGTGAPGGHGAVPGAWAPPGPAAPPRNDLGAPQGGQGLYHQRLSARGTAEIVALLERVLGEIRAAAADADDVTLVGELTLTGKKRP